MTTTVADLQSVHQLVTYLFCQPQISKSTGVDELVRLEMRHSEHRVAERLRILVNLRALNRGVARKFFER